MLNLNDLQLLFKDKLNEKVVFDLMQTIGEEQLIKSIGYALLAISYGHDNIDDKILELIENI